MEKVCLINYILLCILDNHDTGTPITIEVREILQWLKKIGAVRWSKSDGGKIGGTHTMVPVSTKMAGYQK